MQSAAGFPLDIVIFGVITIVLVFRLRGILGRRIGAEPKSPAPQAADPMARTTTPMPPTGPVDLPPPGSPLDQALARLRQAEPAFDPARFLTDAQSAFRVIVLAYARGDLTTIAQLTGAQPRVAFETAIADRNQAGLTQHAEILEITHAEFTDATIDGNLAHVTVKFTSEQISYTTNAQGEITTGHDGRTVIDDAWTFERPIGSPDPTWKLVATHAV